MALMRVVYFSQNLLGLSQRQTHIDALLSKAVLRNRQVQVTGALVHDDLWFVQVLEGAPDAVQSTFDRILKDRRHADVRIIAKRLVDRRLFGDWAMGFARRSPATEHLFGRHWCNSGLNPQAMPEKDVLELMTSLGQQGMLRSSAISKAA